MGPGIPNTRLPQEPASNAVFVFSINRILPRSYSRSPVLVKRILTVRSSTELFLMNFFLEFILHNPILSQRTSPFQDILCGVLPFRHLYPTGWTAKHIIFFHPVNSATAALDADPFTEYFNQFNGPLATFLKQPAFYKAFLPHIDGSVYLPVEASL